MSLSRILKLSTAASLLAVVGGAAFILGGIFDVSARSPHWDLTTRGLELVRDRSIAIRAAGIVPPAGFDAPPRLIEGITHYRAHCAVCHGAPGAEPGELAAGMYPKPPALHHKPARPVAEVFWIVSNGIKMSGMPAWGGDHGDAELWPVVALAAQLPRMSAADYMALSAEADRMSGGRHGHDSGAEPPPSSVMPVAETPAAAHNHDGRSHPQSRH